MNIGDEYGGGIVFFVDGKRQHGLLPPKKICRVILLKVRKGALSGLMPKQCVVIL